jgi:hypothetical protein
MLTHFSARSLWISALCACPGFYQVPVPGWETALLRVVPVQCGLIVCLPGDLKSGYVFGSLGKSHERMVASFTVQKSVCNRNQETAEPDLMDGTISQDFFIRACTNE